MPVYIKGIRLPIHPTDETWRNRAVGLAFEKHVDKQCRIVNTHVENGLSYAEFTCLSATSPSEYTCEICSDTQFAGCMCEAGLRGNPCSHVGAGFLVLYGLTTERRDIPPLAL